MEPGISKEEYIDILVQKLAIETHKNAILYNLCNKLEDYINKHNLLENSIAYKDKNNLQISKIQDLEKITYLEVPKAVFIIYGDKEV